MVAIAQAEGALKDGGQWLASVEQLQGELALYKVQLAATDKRLQQSLQTQIDDSNRHAIEVHQMKSEIKQLRSRSDVQRTKYTEQRRKYSALQAVVVEHDKALLAACEHVAALENERARRDQEIGRASCRGRV